MLLLPLLSVLFGALARGAEQHGGDASAGRVVMLTADTELAVQRLAFGATAVFQVASLLPAAAYEVKISYAASTPAAFAMWLRLEEPEEFPRRSNVDEPAVSPSDNAATASRHQQQRRQLLNTEKLVFRAPATPTTAVFVHVTARPEAVPAPDVPAPRHVQFNIAVERLALGCVPGRVWPLLLWLTALGLVVCTLVYPRVNRLLLLPAAAVAHCIGPGGVHTGVPAR